MKKFKILRLLLIILFLNGCGLISGLKDLTQTANNILENINSITSQIDSKVESGEITQELADLVDGRLDKLAEVIESTIENGGGFVFDRANGTIDNVFQNVSLLLDQIKTGILDESLPNIIDQISLQMQNNINLISSNVEDIIVLTFGNTFVLVDKAVNSIIIISSVILLAIGLLIFVIMLFRKDRSLTTLRIIGLVFMVIYLGFFTSIIFSSRLRGNIIAGFDFGKKYDGIKLSPKIASVYPETFVFGKNDKIFLYGKHLNKIDTLRVVLKSGEQVKFTFPASTIIVKSQNRIVLGNFKKTVNWILFPYESFKTAINPELRSLVSSQGYFRFADETNDVMFRNASTTATAVHPIVPHIAPTTPSVITETPSTVSLITGLRYATNLNVFRVDEKNNQNVLRANTILGVNQANRLITQLKSFFLEKYLLPEGDYGIVAYNCREEIESPQLITIFNPPPPAPKPDIYPMDLTWTGNIQPANKVKTTLDIKLGFSHPEEISREFKIRITSTPPTTPIETTIGKGVIAAAQTANQAIVTTSSFSIDNSGEYLFKVEVDPNNLISEKREDNNTLLKRLTVRKYIYDVTVTYISFESTKNLDKRRDEYRIDIRTTASGYAPWVINYDMDGDPGNIYPISNSMEFRNQQPGNVIILSTSGYEEDSPDPNDYMGAFTKVINLSENPTSNLDFQEREFVLVAAHYKIKGKYIIKRRLQ
ncbi:MAG: hypothetical protein HOO91_21310 [Bacteroidales bacterium]|nr:hypothetical protein [Bacteroidales bacterium]